MAFTPRGDITLYGERRHFTASAHGLSTWDHHNGGIIPAVSPPRSPSDIETSTEAIGRQPTKAASDITTAGVGPPAPIAGVRADYAATQHQSSHRPPHDYSWWSPNL